MNTDTRTSPLNRLGHTPEDWAALVALGVDPATRQPREHPVRCWCGTLTWNRAACCSKHYAGPR